KRVDDRARAQEEQRFKVGMRGEVENTPAVVMRGFAHEHIAQLADGRIGQDALDIELEDSDGRGKERCYSADDADNYQRTCRDLEQRVGARNKVNPCCDHCGSVNERADGRRTFHGIRQPHVQWQLRRLGSTGEEEQQADYRDRSAVMSSCFQRNEDACQVAGALVGKIIQYTNTLELVGADKYKED